MRGFQVAPAELEGHLLGHPRVADACVVGVPDEYSGEVPMAFVVLKADPTGTITAGAFESEAERAALKVELAKVRASCACCEHNGKALTMWRDVRVSVRRGRQGGLQAPRRRRRVHRRGAEEPEREAAAARVAGAREGDSGACRGGGEFGRGRGIGCGGCEAEVVGGVYAFRRSNICFFWFRLSTRPGGQHLCMAAGCRDFTRRVRRACVSCENWEASLTWFASYRCMCEHWQSV